MKKSFLVLSLLLMLANTVQCLARSVDEDSARAQALAGNAAYESGDYTAAIEHFELAIKNGYDGAVLHFNLANSHYKAGNLGFAVLNYLRAERLDPSSSEIQANMHQAHTLLQDKELSSQHLPALLKLPMWVHDRMSLNGWCYALLFSCFLLTAVSIASQWIPTFPVIKARIPALILIFLSLSMSFWHYRGEVLRHSAVVIVEEVEVRSGPGKSYNLSFQIHEGLQVNIAEERDGWLRLDLGGELVGWVPAGELETI